MTSHIVKAYNEWKKYLSYDSSNEVAEEDNQSKSMKFEHVDASSYPLR